MALCSRDEIGACLGSLPRTLDGQLVELIVVDNSSSTDAVGEIVHRDHAWVNYVAAPANLGFGRANNLG